MAVTVNTVLDNLKSSLETNVATLVTAEGLTAVSEFARKDPDFDPLFPSKTPAVWVAGDRVTQSDEEGAASVLEVITATVYIFVGLESGDAAAARANCIAYAGLVRRAVEENAIGSVDHAVVGDLDLSPIAVGEEDALLPAGTVEVHLQRHRSRNDQ